MEKCLRDGDKAAAAKTKREIQHPADTELVGRNTKEEGMIDTILLARTPECGVNREYKGT